ncbi:restriction endonuclease subunit S [Streptomyces sp. NPDC058251]|uniref:restriction endonuclease subunit S n=1 Tax=Streptomyces sp. NPDC058251 TaxID=3346404 RepID=UPI0036E52994
MSEWLAYTLGEVTTSFDSVRVPVKSTERIPGPYPYYGASGVVDHVSDYLFDGEYLLISEDGENLRTRKTPVAFMATGKFWVNNHAHVARGNYLANTQFLCYLLAVTDISGYISGSTQPKLTQASLNSVKLKLPSTRQQDAIVEVLGALDGKIAVNERIATTALNLAEALYVQAADSSVWQSVKLGDAARWMSGGTPKTSEPSYWGGTVPWISALSLKSPWIDRSDRNVTELGAASGTRLVPADTVLFVVRGSSLKEEFRIGITQREVAFGQDCKALIARSGIDSHALFHGIRSQTTSILEMVDETSIGAGRLSTDLISALEIRVPNDPSDSTVAQVRNLDCLAATKRQESQTLAALRDTLLPQLMSGRLRVKDAEKIVEDHT